MHDEGLRFSIDSQLSAQRLDKALVVLLPQFSRTQVQHLIDEGDVLVNDKETKASQKLNAGDQVYVFPPEVIEMNVEPQNIPLDIVYEDDDLLVINKPVDMVVHPAPGHHNDTLVNALLFHFQTLSSVNGVVRPGIVHRIDKDTSGLLMIAKNDEAHEKLAAQLKDKTAYRRYLALVKGEIPHPEGTIRAPIGRSRSDRKKMAVVSEGKAAVTNFKVLERFHGFTLIECLLETGRTHQIRVHLNYIKFPIVGDQVYGGKNDYGFQSQLLHAATLSFMHPKTDKRITVDAPLPAIFEKALEKLRTEGSF